MDEVYLPGKDEKKNFLPLILIFIFIVIIVMGVVFLMRGNKKIISPIPPKPSFEVIFYTPSPLPATPTSTPSATPKVKKTPSPTPKTATNSAVKVSPSPTAKPT